MTTVLLVAVGLTAAAALPALLPLDRAAPLAAAWASLASLAARALLVLLVALGVAFYGSGPLVSVIGHGCTTIALPVVGVVALKAHAITQIAVWIPALALVSSLLLSVATCWRDARRVALALREPALWVARGDARVVPGAEVLVAVAGIRHPRVVVSAGALVALDDEELAASLDHERGHIHRRHRYVILAADLILAFARFLPGARAARADVAYHLERDADQWSLRRNNDPAALARAICKAAITTRSDPSMSTLTGGRTVRRVETLLRSDSGVGPRRRAVTVVATALAVVTASALLTVPATAAAGVHQLTSHQPKQHCSD